jgi:hypothetical protein
VSTHVDPSNKPIPFGLSMTAGAGLILMIIALGFGVVQGQAANSTAIGLTFAGGLGLLIIGIGGWLATVQPFKHFDDINQPMYTGHHDPNMHPDTHTVPESQDIDEANPEQPVLPPG